MNKLNRNKILPILFLVVAIVLPFILLSTMRNPNYIIKICVFVFIYAIAVSGLDILYGYCGQISMGHAGFFAIGAYGSAIISDYFGVPILLSMLISSLISIIISIVISYPAAKLKFHFLSLATIAFGEIVYSFIQASPNEITGNFKGYFPKPIKLFGINFSKEIIFYYFFVLLLAIILLIVKKNIINTKTGRSFIAIRENPTAASGMGINVVKYKIIAFALSAFYVSMAGSLYAHFVNYISPGLFAYDMSVSFMTMLIFGGAGTMMGPVIGVLAIQIINEILRNFDKYQLLFYGVVILVVVMFMPNGLIGIIKKGNKNVKD